MPAIAYKILDLGTLKANHTLEQAFNALGADGWGFIALLPPQLALFRREECVVERRDRGPAAVKYRDPETGETWSGRGRMANWLAGRISAGARIEDFLVADAGSSL